MMIVGTAPWNAPVPTSAKLAEVLTRLFNGLSGEQASIRMGGKPTHNTIYRLRKGIVGDEWPVRRIGQFWAREILETFGGEVESATGRRDDRSAEEWLVSVAMGRRLGRPDPTYEPDLDPLDVKQFKGAEQLPPGDIEEINAVVRALVKEKLRRQGIE